MVMVLTLSFVVDNLDKDEIINSKMNQNEKKYPLEKAKENQISMINFKIWN